MRIPIVDLSSEMQAHWDEFTAAAQNVLRSGRFILGPEVQAFEQEIAAYVGVKHAVACNSGTDALVIGLRALGVGPGDEVITTAFTFFATAEAVSMVGATPVFVDIDPVTYNIDPSAIESAITPRTKAVIPVHLYGNAASLQKILAVAKANGLAVLEDAAQAMGCSYHGKKVGGFGDIAAFSFYPSKNLGAFGDGGLVTTNDDAFASKMKMLRVHGSRKNYFNEMIGYCSRLDEIQAAFLRVKLRYLDASNEGRRSAARRYDEAMSGVPGVTTPAVSEGSHHVYHQYTIRVPANKRDGVAEQLGAKGIATMIYYPVPLHRLPVYASALHAPLPHTEAASHEVISLPIWPTLPIESQLEVVHAIRSALQ